MVAHVRRAERALGRRCRIEMDLAGPKIRTGADPPGAERASAPPGARPARPRDVARPRSWLVPIGRRRLAVDRRGRGGRPARVAAPPRASRADRLHRCPRVVGGPSASRPRSDHADRVETDQGTPTSFPVPALSRDPRRVATMRPWSGPCRPASSALRIAVGDRIVVTARPDPGEDARRNARGRVLRPAHIACTLPAALYASSGAASRSGSTMGGSAASSARRAPERLLVEVLHAPAGRHLARRGQGDQSPGHRSRPADGPAEGPGGPTVHRPARRSRRPLLRPHPVGRRPTADRAGAAGPAPDGRHPQGRDAAGVRGAARPPARGAPCTLPWA